MLACTSSQWDVTDPAAAERNVESGDVVVNCAAYTDVDAAEADEAAAHAVNVAGPDHIAHACARVGARLIHLSTDYVFGGAFPSTPHPYETGDACDPLSVYGRTKLAGEAAVLEALPGAQVVRTSWVYTGGTGSDFVAGIRRLAGGEGPVDVVADQVGSPTYVGDLAVALLQIADGGIRESVLHAANRGAVSRYEQAQAVFAVLGADQSRVRPVSSADVPRPAARPRYSALSGRRSMAAGLTPLRHWLPALTDALRAASTTGPLTSTP